MIVELKIPDSITLEDAADVQMFFQGMLNRIIVGQLRYGRVDCRKRYLHRLSMEIRAYRNSGNFEHLLNLCNYAYLESVAPENKKLFFDPAAASATRDALGGNIA